MRSIQSRWVPIAMRTHQRRTRILLGRKRGRSTGRRCSSPARNGGTNRRQFDFRIHQRGRWIHLRDYDATPRLCWGDSANGQLGAGAAYTCGYTVFPCSVDTPVPVTGDLHFAQISAGYLHTCAITNDGTGYCWGDNRNGELGDPSVPINCVGFPAAAMLCAMSPT